MLAIFKKEFKSYFTSPIAYVFMVVFLFMFGLYFAVLNVLNQSGDYAIVIGSLTSLLFFTIPLLTMRLLSEERRNKTDQLLMTAPIKVSSIILGKYFSAIALFALTLCTTMIHPFILSFFGKIPLGRIFTSYLGYILLGMTLIALGLFISSLCENQIVSAIITIGLFMFLMLVDSITVLIPKQRTSSLFFIIALIVIVCLVLYNSIKNIPITVSIGLVSLAGTLATFFIKGELFDGLPTKLLQWFSIFTRFGDFSNGQLNLSSILYYLSFIAVFIVMTIHVVEKRSWS